MKTIYQTSFAVGTAERKPSLDEVLSVIDAWSSKRLQSHIDFSKIKEEMNVHSGDALLNIIQLSREDTSLVSLTLKHKDKDEKDFQWKTAIHLKEQKNQPHKISIALSNGWSDSTLRPEAEYQVSRPAIVPMLIDAFDCHNFRQLRTQPEILTRENVSDLVSVLYSKRRTLPIVLVTKDHITERSIVNPIEIAKSIVGLAHVYICKDKFVPFKIEDSIGKSMSCYGGAVRIYWPIHGPTDPSLHPLITPQKLTERGGIRARNLHLELLEKLARESTSRVAEVSLEEIQEMRLKLKADFFTGKKDYEELADLYSKENDRLSGENEQLKKDEAASQEKIRTLEAKIAGLLAALNSKGKDEDERLTNTSFRSVEEAVNRIGEIYSEDQLVILGRAQNGAKKCLYEKPEVVFKALEWLATTYKATRKGELKESLETSCTNQTGLHYRAHQSKLTMSQFSNEYTVEYEGKKYSLEEHLAKGTSKDPRHTLRIAFFYDHQKEKAVVGFIGQHQTTNST